MINSLVKNIPNLITLSRLIFTYLIYNLLPNFQVNQILILIYYIVLCFTDFLDGYVARKLNVSSDFGKFFDGFIDYIVTSIIIILFYVFNLIDIKIFAWFAIIIIRDTIRNLIRINQLVNVNNIQKTNISASQLGKISRVIQNIVIGLIIIFPYDQFIIFKIILSQISMVTSVISFINYLN